MYICIYIYIYIYMYVCIDWPYVYIISCDHKGGITRIRPSLSFVLGNVCLIHKSNHRDHPL